jgi:hypothetical protein
LEHLKRRHPGKRLTQAQLLVSDLVSCDCGSLATSFAGIRTHQGKTRCEGWARAQSKAPKRPQQRSTDHTDDDLDSLDLDLASPPSSTPPPSPLPPSSRPRSLLAVPGSSVAASPVMSEDGIVSRFASLASCPAVYKPLPPAWTKPFALQAATLARKYLAEPCDRTLFDFLTLPKVGLAPALKIGANTSASEGKKHLAAFPLVDWPCPAPARGAAKPVPQQVAQAVEQGKLSRAARILADDTAVAPLSDDTIQSLRLKHPQGPTDPFGTRIGTPPASLPSAELITSAFATFKPDTAPGVSGWTPSLLGHALQQPEVSAFLLLLTRQVAQGTAPGRRLLCMSRLTPLLKSDGGIRPIAVGELIYRLVGKVLVRHYSSPSMLTPWQFGVGTPGGTEPITRALERALDDDLPAPYKHVTSLDFSNAFNSLSRQELARGILQHAPSLYRAARWAYNCETPLVVSGDGEPVLLSSSQGVRQGDPFGPLFFSVAIRNTLDGLLQHLGPGHTLLAYLDDIYILSEQPGALDLAAAFFEDNTAASLSLNLRKCAELSLAFIRQDGLRVLGTCIGSPAARSAFLQQQVDAQLPALDRLADLPAQDALLLLRFCLQANLRHLQRSLKTDDLLDPWQQIDDALLSRLLSIRCSPRRLATDVDLVTLPARMGGLGLLSHSEIAPLARAAMADSADALLKLAFAHLDQSTEVIEEEATPLSQRARCQVVFEARREALLDSIPAALHPAILDNSSPIARRWLSAIPFGPNLRLSPTEVAAGLHVRTLCPGKDDHCAHCGLDNTFGHDDICSARPLWRIARHEQVKRLLSHHLSSVDNTTIRLEPFVPGTHLRTDLMITGPASYNGPVCELDIAITSAATLAGRSLLPSSFAPSSSSAVPSPPSFSFVASSSLGPLAAAASGLLLHSLQQTENDKRTKYLGKSSSPFFPFVLSSAGTLSPSSLPLLNQWKSQMLHFSLFTRLLSLQLLRARARFYSF